VRNLVASFPRARATASDDALVVVVTERSEGKAAVVLSNVPSNVPCFSSLVSKKGTKGQGRRQLRVEDDFAMMAAMGERR
jgi:hypothetical protein